MNLPTPSTHAAIAAAQAAAEAASELLRFAREGAIASDVAVFDWMNDPGAALTNALAITLQIDITLLSRYFDTAEYVSAAADLRHALGRFLYETTGDELPTIPAPEGEAA